MKKIVLTDDELGLIKLLLNEKGYDLEVAKHRRKKNGLDITIQERGSALVNGSLSAVYNAVEVEV